MYLNSLAHKMLPLSVKRRIDIFYNSVQNDPWEGIREFLADAYSDALAISGVVSYKYPIIFIAGLPKSGTTWLVQLLREVPGYIQLDHSCFRSYAGLDQLAHVHDVHRNMFSDCPKNRYSFLKLHTHCSENNLQILESFDIRPVILIRDLRDMMISRYYHILAQRDHWMHSSINKLDFSNGFLRSLDGIKGVHNQNPLDYYAQWVVGWIKYSKEHPHTAMLLRFEEMKSDVNLALDRLFKFYEINFKPDTIDRITKLQKKKFTRINNRSLRANLFYTGRVRSTFRKGGTNEWKKRFNQTHKEQFKQRAAEALILSGYEKDTNW